MTVTAVRASGTNWSGNVTFSADEVQAPTSVQELCDLVAGAAAEGRTVRAVGSRHSFNTIADSPDVMVSLAGLPATVEVDPAARTATVPAGIRFGELAGHLNAAHLALHNTGSLPHISVVGACATGTHGSGVTNGNLATAVRALTMVTADGQVRTVARDTDGETFRAAALGLGCLGLVTRVTLDVQPEYRVRQDVYEDLPFDVFAEHAEELFAAGYSVSLFTLWRGSTFHQVYVKQRLEDGSDGSAPADLFGARAADGQRHPVLGGDPASCTQQGGVPGLWSERLYHFRLDFTPSHGDEIQTEYLIPREHAVAAIRAVETISEPRLRAGQRRPALHLARRHRGRAGRVHRSRGGAGRVRAPAALGQGVHHPARPARRALPGSAGVPGPGRGTGPARGAPQRLPARHRVGGRALSGPATPAPVTPGPATPAPVAPGPGAGRRVAVVGSGPAGVYATEALLDAGVAVDVLDRLPAPFGLVRYGVAPDHLKIKSIAATLTT